MEVRVRERLIGALVLVALVVLLVPAILKGRGSAPAEPPADATRRVEVPTNDAAPPLPEEVLVPEPAADTAPAVEPADARTPPNAAPVTATLPAAKPDSDVNEDSPVAAALSPKPQAVSPPPLKPALPKPTSAGTAWAVQLGAFSNRGKAEQLVAELKKRRYAAFILEYRAAGQVLYRVRVGPEQERARAEEIAGRLAKDGFQPVVARHP